MFTRHGNGNICYNTMGASASATGTSYLEMETEASSTLY